MLTTFWPDTRLAMAVPSRIPLRRDHFGARGRDCTESDFSERDTGVPVREPDESFFAKYDH